MCSLARSVPGWLLGSAARSLRSSLIIAAAAVAAAACVWAGGVKPSQVIGIPQNGQGCVPYSMIFPHFGQAKASTVSAM
jgi:hypothetical protein